MAWPTRLIEILYRVTGIYSRVFHTDISTFHIPISNLLHIGKNSAIHDKFNSTAFKTAVFLRKHSVFNNYLAVIEIYKNVVDTYCDCNTFYQRNIYCRRRIVSSVFPVKSFNKKLLRYSGKFSSKKIAEHGDYSTYRLLLLDTSIL